MKGSERKYNTLSELKLFGIFFLIIIPLIYVPSILDAALMPRMSFFSAAIAGMFIYVFFALEKQQKTIDLRTIFTLPVLLLLGYFIVAGLSILVAVNPSQAITEWLLNIPFIAFVMLGSLVFSRENEVAPVVTKFVIVFGILHSIIGLIQFVNLTTKIGLSHELSYYVTGLSAHRNLYSQVLFLTVPFSLFGIYIYKQTWRWLAILASVLSLGLITVLLAK
jgi:hypothetical protein